MVDECGWVMADYGKSDFSECGLGCLRWWLCRLHILRNLYGWVDGAVVGVY